MSYYETPDLSDRAASVVAPVFIHRKWAFACGGPGSYIFRRGIFLCAKVDCSAEESSEGCFMINRLANLEMAIVAAKGIASRLWVVSARNGVMIGRTS